MLVALQTRLRTKSATKSGDLFQQCQFSHPLQDQSANLLPTNVILASEALIHRISAAQIGKATWMAFSSASG